MDFIGNLSELSIGKIVTFLQEIVKLLTVGQWNCLVRLAGHGHSWGRQLGYTTAQRMYTIKQENRC
jgi:hypothetical protein